MKEIFILFLIFSVLVADPKKLPYTVADLARGLLNWEKSTRESLTAHHPPKLLVRRCVHQRGKAINPARGTRKINTSLSPFAPENFLSRDGFGRTVPRQPAHSPHSD